MRTLRTVRFRRCGARVCSCQATAVASGAARRGLAVVSRPARAGTIAICIGRNAIETQRNETKRNETKRNRKRNETKRNEDKPRRDETKRDETKQNGTERNGTERHGTERHGTEDWYMCSRGNKFRNENISSFPLVVPHRTNVVIRTGRTGGSHSCPNDSQLPKHAASAPSRAAFQACSPAPTQRVFASRPFPVASARIPSRKRECQASRYSAASSAHSRRNANFGHSAFQDARRVAAALRCRPPLLARRGARSRGSGRQRERGQWQFPGAETQ